MKFPGRLVIIYSAPEQPKIKELLSKYLKFFEQPEKNWVDDAAKWLADKVPLENK